MALEQEVEYLKEQLEHISMGATVEEMEALQQQVQQLTAEVQTSTQLAAQEGERANLMQEQMEAHMNVLAAKADAELDVRKQMGQMAERVEQLQDELSRQESFVAALQQERAEWQSSDVQVLSLPLPQAYLCLTLTQGK